MNVTFNTANFNNYKNYNNQRKNSSVAFTSVVVLPQKSGLLNPFKNSMDKITDFIAKRYTKHVYESPIAKWLSRREDASQIVNHMQMLGSVIVSGMYMTQTLRNKNMDDETKKKLSINQALTWVAATAGAYWLDDFLAQTWDNKVSLKYAKKFLNDPELAQKIANHNKELKEVFEKDAKNTGKKFEPDNVLKYVTKKVKNAALETDLKGLDVLKSLVVFGTIYRFVSPVAVTPIANWVGDKFFSSKNTKDLAFGEKEVQNQNVVLNTPKMSNFAGGFEKTV